MQLLKSTRTYLLFTHIQPTEDELSRFVPTSPSELFLGVVFAFPCIIFLVNLVRSSIEGI